MALSAAEQQKYDRQLRLWGVHGQRRLMASHVCLLNAGPTGTEALKNLVLPGIGQFTVVDDQLVTEFDCTNNFFVDPVHVGKPRAQVVTELLTELNGDVKGNAVKKDPRALIAKDAKFFEAFTLIIATQLDEACLVGLGDICKRLKIPLVIARTYGLIGHVRLYATEHHVVELKPSPEVAPDLRVSNPWPELKALADQVDLSKLDDFEFKHVPFVLILMKLLDQWRAVHGGKVPENTQQKEEFKKSIKAIARQPWGMEENLTEALDKSFQAFRPAPVSFEVESILQDAQSQGPVKKDTSHFWIMARALASFYKEHGTLPLPGTLPDMTATTERFVELQQCFADRAQRDFSEFSKKVDILLKEAGLDASVIPSDQRHLFCSNAQGLVCTRFRTLRDEFENPSVDDFGVYDLGDHPPYMNPFVWYILWRACDNIFASDGAYPGQDPEASETELAAAADKVLGKAKAMIAAKYPNFSEYVAEALKRDCAVEIVRYGAAEMHNIAALIGGIAAEETVKLLTQQYQPLNNTYVFNGISGVGKFFSM